MIRIECVTVDIALPAESSHDVSRFDRVARGANRSQIVRIPLQLRIAERSLDMVYLLRECCLALLEACLA